LYDKEQFLVNNASFLIHLAAAILFAAGPAERDTAYNKVERTESAFTVLV
jgi:hypothetical protein